MLEILFFLTLPPPPPLTAAKFVLSVPLFSLNIGGIYFNDLPSNMLGSFVIGLFAASSTVGLANRKAIVLLPKTHSWQNNFPVQIGIRTGYCGSLTTFSSWIKDLFITAIQTNDYVSAVLGLFVGLYAAIISYTVGVHLALYLDRWLTSNAEDVIEEETEYRNILIGEYRAASRELKAFNENSKGNRGGGGGGSGGGGGAGSMVAEPAGLDALSEDQAGLMEAEDDLPRIMINHPSGAISTAMSAAKSRQLEQQQGASPRAPPNSFKTDLAALITLVGLTSWCIVGSIIQGNHSWLRTCWLSLLFAPFGCTLRWLLARLNYKLKGRWAWAPLGTFSANMVGTAISTALSVVGVKVELTAWGSAVNGAAISGFCGALTTVSTFVTEIVQYTDVLPESIQAYTYAVGTVLSGVVVVIALYGWTVWS